MQIDRSIFASLASSTGPTLVSHECPRCGGVSSAPLRKVAAGTVGYWCCDSCDAVFRVRMSLEAVGVERPGLRRNQENARTYSKLPEGTRQQRLLELHGEASYLRSQLQEIDETITGLQ